ncbi:maleylpyruvate isomerase N-terminal domain-containing protein [Streptomyces sp. NPDC059248]|uniref:maleylpyruvate isomerase N-terminal domain-containing protein n=1 Tax=Streptomyces sp. NPDC059248 TaxID=3346791 RepID=UPI0036D118AF
MSDPAPDPGDVFDDLREESAGLDALVAPLPAADWARETPAKGWTVAQAFAGPAGTGRPPRGAAG